MNPVIQLQKLTKYYGEQGASSISIWRSCPGAFSAILAPNGASKTTTIRLLLDLIRPTAGAARVFGLDAQAGSLEIRRRIGYLPADPSSLRQSQRRAASTLCLQPQGRRSLAQYQAPGRQAGVRPFPQHSHLVPRQQAEIAVIRAFMHEPELLILDEPTSGLDPLMQQEFESMVREVKADGRTVFLSSHIIPEVEELCDRVAIIRDGSLVAVEDVATFKARSMRSLELRFGETVSENAFQGVDGVRNVAVDGSTLKCEVVGSLDQFIKTAARYEVVDMTVHEPSLEEVFLAFYGEEESDASA